jgi:phage portal protein BeeE
VSLSVLRPTPDASDDRIDSRAVLRMPPLAQSLAPGSRYTDHRLYRLLHDAANPQQTSFEFRAALMANTLISGNGYAEIERNNGDGPVALWHLEPHRVSPR